MKQKDKSWIVWYIVSMLLFLLLAILLNIWIGKRTAQYHVVGFKDGEKVERVVTLSRNYKYGPWLHIYRGEQNVAKTVNKDGYTCHRVFYTNPIHKDTICGFDSIVELKRLKH